MYKLAQQSGKKIFKGCCLKTARTQDSFENRRRHEIRDPAALVNLKVIRKIWSGFEWKNLPHRLQVFGWNSNSISQKTAVLRLSK